MIRLTKMRKIDLHLPNTGASPRTMCYCTCIQFVLRARANGSSNLVLPSTSVSAPSDCRVSFVFYNDIIASTVQTRSRQKKKKTGKGCALNSGKCSAATGLFRLNVVTYRSVQYLCALAAFQETIL